MLAEFGVAKLDIAQSRHARFQDVRKQCIEARDIAEKYDCSFRDLIANELPFDASPLIVIKLVCIVFRLNADLTGLHVLWFDVVPPGDRQHFSDTVVGPFLCRQHVLVDGLHSEGEGDFVGLHANLCAAGYSNQRR